jgi:hypothetical protein
MEQEASLSQSMAILAGAAVIAASDTVEFDYSEDSVQRLEDYIERHNQLGLDPENDIAPNTKYWGAYLGEVFRRNIGGEWIEFQNQLFKAIGVRYKKIIVFPIDKVRKRILEGRSHNLVAFYKTFKAQMLTG